MFLFPKVLPEKPAVLRGFKGVYWNSRPVFLRFCREKNMARLSTGRPDLFSFWGLFGSLISSLGLSEDPKTF